MTTDHERLRSYYAGFSEWDRLDSPSGSLEFARTMQIIEEWLPPASRVLDLGGGPGRYALALASRGHRIILADLSPVLLNQARARVAASDMQDHIESVDEVNAQDLQRYSNESFDAVLAFGPFYHLVLEAERIRAAREIGRVLRKGGLALVAFIPRMSGIAGLIERAAHRPGQVTAETLRIAAETGVFRNSSSNGFQEGYYPLPGELEDLLGTAGLQVLASVSLRSVAYRLEKELSELGPAVRAEADRVLASMSTWPEVVASGGHALVIARRVA